MSVAKPSLALTASLFSVFVLLTSCGGGDDAPPAETKLVASQATEAPAKPELIIDLKTISGKTLEEVEKVLGKAESKEAVKGYPCSQSACEQAIFRQNGYEIIFKNGKADHITINSIPDLTKNVNAIQALGFPASQPSFSNPGTVVKWTGVDGMEEISFFTDYALIKLSPADE